MTNAVNVAQGGTNNVSWRNRIINGDMRIDQRNAGAAVTASLSYPVDRFLIVNQTDGSFSAQRVTSSASGFNNALKVTVTATDSSLAATQYFDVVQNIEGVNIADLGFGLAAAQNITLSFVVKSSVTGTFGGAIMNNALNRAYPFTYTISAANTEETKTVTITGDTTGTWLTDNQRGMRVGFCLGSGSDYLATAGAWVGTREHGPTGQTNLFATSGATWEITGVQLEAGTVASPFERRDYGRELMMCQRYYEVGGRTGWVGYSVAAAQTVIGFVGYCVAKRSAATITVPSYALSGTSASGPYSATTDGFEINGTTTTASGTVYIIANSWSASSEL